VGEHVDRQLAHGALLVGAALLMWALGGIWTSQRDFLPDFQPRLLALTQTEAKANISVCGAPAGGHAER
jgi:hypothetical protein